MLVLEVIFPLYLIWAYFSEGRLLIPKSNNEDAVSLADAALGPRCHSVVGLVKDDPIYVLLLGQPARETVLVDTDEHRKRIRHNSHKDLIKSRGWQT